MRNDHGYDITTIPLNHTSKQMTQALQPDQSRERKIYKKKQYKMPFGNRVLLLTHYGGITWRIEFFVEKT